MLVMNLFITNAVFKSLNVTDSLPENTSSYLFVGLDEHTVLCVHHSL